MATDKKRVSLYVDEEIKQNLCLLAKLKKRSISNLVELICEEAIAEAKQRGEL